LIDARTVGGCSWVAIPQDEYTKKWIRTTREILVSAKGRNYELGCLWSRGILLLSCANQILMDELKLFLDLVLAAG